MSPLTTKALGAERNANARAFCRALLFSRFDGNISLAARALRVSQPHVSSFLLGRVGAGMKLLDGMARVTGASVDTILGYREPAALLVAPTPPMPVDRAPRVAASELDLYLAGGA